MQTNCCIVGGGPAGIMLGLLLARSGVETLVLEKHADFFRDFRGDTIHPSTLEIMHELGFLEEFLQRPHQVATQLCGYIENQRVTIADFSKLKVTCPYVAFMPQWDFLNFLANEAKKYPNFNLQMQTEATNVIVANGVVVGVQANTPSGTIEIHSNLVIGADGRHSTIRDRAGLQVEDIAAPMDVFWFRLSRKDTDPNETFGKFSAGKILIVIDRLEYWQCGYVIAKGTANIHQQQDIAQFRYKIAATLPFLQDRVHELQTWDDVKLLSVKIDRLKQWYRPGLLCIGDAAHAMSPVGGVGINLAIQDAVATANILSPNLKQNNVTVKELHAVQRRRIFPTIVIQKLQVMIQKRVISNVLNEQTNLKLPWFIRQIQRLSMFKCFLGSIIGIGVRPEKIAHKTSKPHLL